MIKVFNAEGKLIEAINSPGINKALQFGSNYAAGVYYSEITQDRKKIRLSLIKLKN
jgi:hypothetical protein